jgi:hypothetical protein
LAELAGYITKLRQGMPAVSGGATETVEARASQAFGAAGALRREITNLIQAACTGEFLGRVAPDREAARERAAALWEFLGRGGEARIGLGKRITVEVAWLCRRARGERHPG